MKKSLLFILFLVATLGMSFNLFAETYVIGDGTDTQNFIPAYGYYDYGWSKMIYTATELNTAGLTGPATISGIGFEQGNTVTYTYYTQTTYLRHTTATVEDVVYPDNTQFSQVFTGDVTFSGGGWHYIEFDTPFEWNGTDNIEILWENWDGDYASGYANFTYTPTPEYMAVYKYADSEFPTTDGSTTYFRPNITIITPATTPPAPTTAISPLHEAVDVFLYATLNWYASFGATGYKLSFGTDDPPTNIENGTDLGDVLTYDPTPDMDYSTTYYWQVVPYNTYGDAVGCPVWSFTTGADPTITTLPHTEDFDAATPPDLPYGWTNIVETTSSSPYVETYSSTTYAVSPPNCLRMYNSSDLDADLRLVSPPLSMALNTLRVSFSARGSAGVELLVGTMPSPTGDFTQQAVIPMTTTHTLYSVDFDTYAGTDQYIAFKHGQTTTYDYIYMDDVTIMTIPTSPIFSLNPDVTSWDFGEVEINTAATQEFTISNIGAGNLVLSSVVTTGDYYSISVPPDDMDLAAGESTSFTVQFLPTVGGGPYTGTLEINDNRALTSVALTGMCFDPTVSVFPYLEDFGTGGDAFPPPAWTRFSGLLVDPVELVEGTGYWYQDDWCNVVEDPSNESARMNIYGTTRKGWLVTPPIDLGTAKTDYSLEFDIALTDYYNAAPPDDPNGYSGVDDKFAVIISLDGGLSWTTANILAMWDNDPDTDSFVYNDVPHTGQHVIIPLTGFSGIVKIAFYGESTVSNADNDFFVDNVMIDEAGEPPTPVELSSFTAAVTADTEVTLTWVTESETQMMGYQIYRATSDDQSASTLISNTMIPATNTSNTQTYTRVDPEVEIGGTYYYWLETVGYSTSEYYGPVSVTVEGNVPPVLPEITSMKSAYPNPFRAATNIEVGLKAGETGNVTIYNVHGQVVKSFAVTQGYHTLNWDGRDANNNACASGIYFYKLSTPSFNKTMKMMLIK